MGKFRITGGNITVAGRTHRNGATISFEGVPVPVGLCPLDAEARRQKLLSITEDELAKAHRFPQRVKLLAESLGENGDTPDLARRLIREWVAEQMQAGTLR